MYKHKIGIIVGNINLTAGTERAVTNLANGLAGRHQVVLISVYSSSEDPAGYILDREVITEHLGFDLQPGYVKRVPAYRDLYRSLVKIITEYDLDILIGTTHAYNVIISMLSNRVRTIGCEHINYNACPRVFRPVRKIAYKNLDAVVLLTNEDKRNYSFLNEDKLRVIPNISSFRHAEKAALENKLIVTAGRLAPQKGYDILIDMARDLKRILPDWRIDIYGKGDMLSLLTEKIRANQLEEYVQIKKPVKNIREVFLQSSIYLMTSRNEGLPMVLIEAQTCGLPIVSFDCPEGPAEIINNGHNGFLIPVGNSAAMVDRLAELAADKELRVEFGNNAYTDSMRFSEEEVIKNWEKLFSDVSKKAVGVHK